MKGEKDYGLKFPDFDKWVKLQHPQPPHTHTFLLSFLYSFTKNRHSLTASYLHTAILTLVLIMFSEAPPIAFFSQPSKLLAKLRIACVNEPNKQSTQCLGVNIDKETNQGITADNVVKVVMRNSLKQFNCLQLIFIACSTAVSQEIIVVQR